MTKQIVVIGGGPAGIEAALSAAGAGAAVTLISDGPVGGRAGWHSLLPSKVWLTAADTMGLAAGSAALGLQSGAAAAAAPEIVARINAVRQSWNSQQAQALTDAGVTLLTGIAAFENAATILVKNADGDETDRLSPDAVIVAGGSVPYFPPNLRPDGRRVIAPRFAGALDELPGSVVVIGAGATGSETVYMFNRLGVDVTWVVDQAGVLPTFAPAAGQFLAETLARRGVKIVAGPLADRIDRDDSGVTVLLSDGGKLRAEMAFVAIGRSPDLGRLNIEATGAAMAGKSPQVDDFGRTSVPGLYVVGDAAGPPMLANRAMAQGWVAGRHAAGAEVAPFRQESVVHAIYTEPQVAEVGRVQGDDLHRVRVNFGHSLKSHLQPEGDGFAELAFDAGRRITGAVAVGPHAADVLSPVAVAIQLYATLDDIAPIFVAHPTLSELVFAAARRA
ncbi:MAG: NAD(P)/FAD-dependent oxidoreductase [Anaerolineae bacterium]